MDFIIKIKEHENVLEVNNTPVSVNKGTIKIKIDSPKAELDVYKYAKSCVEDELGYNVVKNHSFMATFDNNILLINYDKGKPKKRYEYYNLIAFITLLIVCIIYYSYSYFKSVKEEQ